MTTEKFAQMPNCNLAESIHNKWLQASGNKGGDLYVAIVDDYVRAFLQVVAYHQFLKGGFGGDGLAKKGSSFAALNVVLNVLVTPLSFKRFSTTSKVEMISVLVVPISRVPRSSARGNASLPLSAAAWFG